MTLVSLTYCSHLLALDPKTLRRWMGLLGICAQPHPTDARLKCLTPQQVQQLAQTHRRTLADEVQPAISAPTTASRVVSPSVGSDVLPDRGALVSSSLTKQLDSLQAHVATLEQQLTLVTDQLQKEQQWRRSQASQAPATSLQQSRERSQGSSKGNSLRSPKEKSQGSSRENSLQSSREKSQGSSKQKGAARAVAHPASLEGRKRSHVLPLVEYGTDGRYVVICPTQGLLAFEPDSAEWFAWLSTLSSFRFVGPSGHLTVHRTKCSPDWSWRATRSIRSRSHSLHLVRTESLTIAVLEQAAASLQSLLN